MRGSACQQGGGIKMSEKRLLDNIKAVFLCALVILVFINTIVLASIVPFIGHHLMPGNQAGASAWETIAMVMTGCMAAIIMSVIAYGTVKVIKWEQKQKGGVKK